MYESLFQVLNALASIPWLLMIILPGWRGTEFITRTPMVPMLLGVVYAGLLFPGLMGGGDGGMASLADLRTAFGSDATLLLGWVHYLAFDMMVGFWEWRDSRRLRIPHALMVPCLLGTFMLGPVGLLLYMSVRWIRTRRLSFEEAAV